MYRKTNRLKQGRRKRKRKKNRKKKKTRRRIAIVLNPNGKLVLKDQVMQQMGDDMEIDTSNPQLCQAKGNEEKNEKSKKGLLVMLVGAPGSGKSTFCENVMRESSRPWVRICQDIINNGKAGNKTQCLSSATAALKDGKSIFIDRCNLDREQRAEFVKLGSPEVDLHAVVLDFPAQLCISRSVKRTGHEGKLHGGKAAAVVNRMLQKKEFPKLNEGYSRITFYRSESDVQDGVTMYRNLGPFDTLPHGCFGERNPNAKVQLGIMKFLKKVDPPGQDSGQSIKEKETRHEQPKDVLFGMTSDERKQEEHMTESADVDASLVAVPTLAFPSISTADFQFDLEKASDIIAEKVQEYINKLGNGRLVLVDLSHKSKILSLVKAKARERNIDSKKFFTFVGDITCLYSKGGLHCNVIANAANWRLKPGGGGVNAAIFGAGGPSLVTATKQQATSLTPGKAVVVPLTSISPLFSREGVTHVIHVLGPNMNPQRPNCLKNNYDEGSKILRDAYSSLFEGFVSILKTQSMGSKENNERIMMKQLELQDHSVSKQVNSVACEQKVKREGVHGEEKSKKYKGLNHEVGCNNAYSGKGKDQQKDPKSKVGASKTWGSWAQALYNIAMDPEKHKNDVIEIHADIVVLNDLYPKAKKHILVLARLNGLNQLADVCREHLQLLKTVHEVGMKWVQKFLQDDESLIFRLGFHSVPSMRQLHLHVISQDFDSKCLKHKKHWNSFNTEFFRDAVDVIEEVDKYGKASIQDESLLSKELRCHKCKSAHPSIPRLKSHICNCKAPFPKMLLENNRLILAPPKTDANL